MDLEQIQEDVKNTLSEVRYNHSRAVMEMCEKLAVQYNVDIETAKKVGIAHDIAKEMPEEEKLQYIKDNNIKIDEIEKTYTRLLHAKIGADIGVKRYGFTKEMADAVKCHTTGRENMTILDKILYMADETSLERDFEDVEYIRKLVFEDIDEAVIYFLEKVMKKMFIQKDKIHIDTVLARNSLLKNK